MRLYAQFGKKMLGRSLEKIFNTNHIFVSKSGFKSRGPVLLIYMFTLKSDLTVDSSFTNSYVVEQPASMSCPECCCYYFTLSKSFFVMRFDD